MNPIYTIDLSLKPTTFDLWHVCLAGTVALLSLILDCVAAGYGLQSGTCKKKPAEPLFNKPCRLPNLS